MKSDQYLRPYFERSAGIALSIIKNLRQFGRHNCRHNCHRNGYRGNNYRAAKNYFWGRWIFVFSLMLAGALAAPMLSSVAAPLQASTLIYTVEEGDTLESIAQRFKVSLASLQKINRFSSYEQAQQSIIRGQSILIPAPDIVFASVGAQGVEITPAVPAAQVSTQVSTQASAQANVPAKEKKVAQEIAERAAENSGVALRKPVTARAAPQINSVTTEEYRVRAGDTISSLAARFNSSSAAILAANGLAVANIFVGQILRLPVAAIAATQAIYTVVKGDTLLAISRKTETSVGVLRSLNQLENDHIRPGQTLRISSYQEAVRAIGEDEQGHPESFAAPTARHYRVANGDTLSSIGRRFNVLLSDLLKWNNISNADKLRHGQELVIARPSTTTYTVKKGDTLWAIALSVGSSVAQLRRANPGFDELLHPGQTLQIVVEVPQIGARQQESSASPNSLPESSSTAADTASKDLLGLALPNVYNSKEEEEATIRAEREEAAYRQLEARQRQKINVGPPASLPQAPASKNRPVDMSSYFTRNIPRVPRQPNSSYYEEFTDDPLENYQMARKLLADFDRDIEALPVLSDKLAGYSVLLDPGHGGVDPGFNSQSEDGNGNPLYIIEDEYNYDYALRLYRHLKRHGAQVGLTIMSPNHLIFDSPDASLTLVSQKNEVYNSPFINQRGEYNSWPIGTKPGLHKRVKVAESFFNGRPKSKRIFISLHNDNSPRESDGRMLLYYDDSLTIDKLGRQMAEFMVPYLGKNAHARGQNLAVLRKNPARYAVLVELRNIAHPRNSWAIRNAALRQEDTEMLVDGILSFVQSLQK